MNQRILELAIEELTRQKVAIEAEIEIVRGELRQSGSALLAKAPVIARASKHVRSATQRKVQSERMKKYWAAKRSPVAAAKGLTKSKPKAPKETSKAISDAMRAYWAKRKAAGKNFKAKSKETPSK